MRTMNNTIALKVFMSGNNSLDVGDSINQIQILKQTLISKNLEDTQEFQLLKEVSYLFEMANKISLVNNYLSGSAEGKRAMECYMESL